MTLACTCAAWLAVPSLATAQAPGNDNYLGSTAINSFGSPLPTVNTRTGTIVDATVQPLTSSRAAPEVRSPRTSGASGRATRSSASATPSGGTSTRTDRGSCARSSRPMPSLRWSGVMPFDSDGAVPNIGQFRCVVGRLGNATLDYEFRVQEGGGYTIQIGASGRPRRRGPLHADPLLQPRHRPRRLRRQPRHLPDSNGGPNLIGGCPDGDGDGVIDRNDRCQGPKGTPAHQRLPGPRPRRPHRSRRQVPARDHARLARPQRQRLSRPRAAEARDQAHPGLYCTGSGLPRDPGEEAGRLRSRRGARE